MDLHNSFKFLNDRRQSGTTAAVREGRQQSARRAGRLRMLKECATIARAPRKPLALSLPCYRVANVAIANLLLRHHLPERNTVLVVSCQKRCIITTGLRSRHLSASSRWS
eukprot:TRINITY_DN7671_c0_g1_i4.p1 TRINITY_DN7671_c0_g1~~TRINITY_DN7671_c0_g1_i4.p1  ORF type:complete len:110 (-),score=8.76 TRINITY_DN7671_c0_g1_i4:88-417(-)